MTAGLVSLVVSWIAVFGAALAGGVLPAGIVQSYPQLGPAEQDAMEMVWRYNSLVNQTLGKVWVAATCTGVLLWSPITWHYDRLWKFASGFR